MSQRIELNVLKVKLIWDNEYFEEELFKATKNKL